MTYKPLPIGVDDFKDLITKDYYYVDKTWMIKELLDRKEKVNLFTRPSLFGKTLNLSMLRYFFEIPEDGKTNRTLFEDLRILDAGERYTSEQEQYPVINLTLKSGKQGSFELAYGCLKEAIAYEYSRHQYLLDTFKTKEERDKFYALMTRQAPVQDYLTSLLFLSKCLKEYHGKQVIILIDEYDIPLENAYYTGFYDEMMDFIRSLFESALKTNPYLEFSIITGCLRISKESIFTGLNNLEMISILNEHYGEHFGFVEREVQEMLRFYGREESMGVVKKWYDGYRFGNAEVYNPWSVINYVKALYTNPQAFPGAHWSNTSSNRIVKDLIQRADFSVKGEIETLIAGETIEKQVHEEITYADIYDSEDNLWNFLFFTGYLKAVDKRMIEENQYVTMTIPNAEVRSIYRNTIVNWFRDEIKTRDLSVMYQALMAGDGEMFQKELSVLLMNSISYMDSREAFYHGFLLGVLGNMREYLVKSNQQAGLGRYDICVRSLNVEMAPVVLELKVSPTFKGMEASCDEAIKQIHDKHYDDWLPEEGYTEVLNVGVAFFKKQCRVKVERIALE
ncbi:MAG: AAA family ATPase [Lachnospiraceae bacterium]|nr:AAA family ATPase [Lachnospiraceae bacterium]